jgi:hypothetical protein
VMHQEAVKDEAGQREIAVEGGIEVVAAR